jgi:hypothetical protein
MKTSNIYTLLSLCLFLLCSCATIHYQAHYEFRPRKTENGLNTDPKSLIIELAEKRYLRIDSALIKKGFTDTIGFSGLPYHYFQFVFHNKDSNKQVIKLDYHGGPGRTGMYQDFLNNLTAIIGDRYEVTYMHLK